MRAEHVGHVPTPLSTAGSSIATVIGELAHQQSLAGGRTTVVVSHNRDLRIQDACNALVDYTSTCPRQWFTPWEYRADFIAGNLGAIRPYAGRLQLPAIEAMRRADPDVVVVHDGHYGAASLPLWRREWPAGRLVLHVHNPLSRSYGRRELRRTLSAAEGLVFVSEHSRTQLVQRCDPLPVPSAVVPNGVNAGVFHPRGRKESERIRVTFAGQVAPHKGAHLLLEAIAASRLEEPLLRVVGSRSHMRYDDLSGYERSLRQRADDLGIEVEWIPFVARPILASILRDTDIFCMPSLWDEPFGMAALEAMSCGAAVIASRRGGLPEACGTGAILIDPEDTGEFAAALDILGEPRRREVQQGAALAWARTRSWDASFDSFQAAMAVFLK